MSELQRSTLIRGIVSYPQVSSEGGGRFEADIKQLKFIQDCLKINAAMLVEPHSQQMLG